MSVAADEDDESSQDIAGVGEDGTMMTGAAAPAIFEECALRGEPEVDECEGEEELLGGDGLRRLNERVE